MRIIRACVPAYKPRSAAVTTARQLAALTGALRQRLADGGNSIDVAEAELALTALNLAVADIRVVVEHLHRVLAAESSTATALTAGPDSPQPGMPSAAVPQVESLRFAADPAPASTASIPEGPAPLESTAPDPEPLPDLESAQDPEPEPIASQAASIAGRAAALLQLLCPSAPWSFTFNDLEQLAAALTTAADDLDAISQHYLAPTRQRRSSHLTAVAAAGTDDEGSPTSAPSCPVRAEVRPTPFLLARRGHRTTSASSRVRAGDLLAPAT
ncbi:hypothetical protein QEZ54_08520 [Catellatospora sp. KI3]|uniref:hypothetical protein n=1 Tax=Catellatospora sp. KI3 TaxID=3041620 RepID=UPI002482CED3|nr:hypothetical protein [Catellatospora sp. KI3]MDI1461005.1 hypothetical protein [Catellatospora sp. KI3]